ncbi:cytochrome c [Mesorhizobium plurifarium]|uniref:c-type cytochrome n=1 Tax=Sinorhizobium arboris TaxID=76745 RepID=UPI000488AB89|nr:cytochrome c [Sinorhizobium arboris]PST24103.1 cytochrome c [Mesorhizobium plurifarium]
MTYPVRVVRLAKTVPFSVLGIAAIGLGLMAGWPWLAARMANGEPSAETIALGKRLYAKHCAVCHGANLEGQRDWKSPLPSGRMPAPPHDASGHTWHHADGMLIRITKEGPSAVVGGGYESDMPGFGKIMSDEETRAVLAYIKSTWPEQERAYQAEMSRQERETAQ